MLTTTLNLLKEHGACADRYRVLLKALGGAKKYGYDKPITMAFILESNGLDDCLWAMRAVDPSQEAERDYIYRIFACNCAARSLPIFEKQRPNDKRVRGCIKIARLFAEGKATHEELAAARDAAWAAARDAADAADAAWAAAWAAADAARAAWAAARDAADAADAAWAAAWAAARDAADAADAAWAAAWAAARAAMKDDLKKLLERS